MPAIVRRMGSCRAKGAINRPIYTGVTPSPLKWGLGDLEECKRVWKHGRIAPLLASVRAMRHRFREMLDG